MTPIEPSPRGPLRPASLRAAAPRRPGRAVTAAALALMLGPACPVKAREGAAELLARGRIEFSGEDPARAEESLLRAVEAARAEGSGATEGEAWFYLGRAAERRSRRADAAGEEGAAALRSLAAERYERALALLPESGAVMHNLARLEALSGRGARAEDLYRRAAGLEDDPRRGLYRRRLGDLLADRGDWSGAADAYALALAAEPRDTDAHERLTALLAEHDPLALEHHLRAELKAGRAARAETGAVAALTAGAGGEAAAPGWLALLAKSLAARGYEPRGFEASETAAALRRLPELPGAREILRLHANRAAAADNYPWWSARPDVERVAFAHLARSLGERWLRGGETGLAESRLRLATALAPAGVDLVAARLLAELYWGTRREEDLRRLARETEPLVAPVSAGGDPEQVVAYRGTVGIALQALGGARQEGPVSAEYQLARAVEAEAEGGDSWPFDARVYDTLAGLHERAGEYEAEARVRRLQREALERAGDAKGGEAVVSSLFDRMADLQRHEPEAVASGAIEAFRREILRTGLYTAREIEERFRHALAVGPPAYGQITGVVTGLAGTPLPGATVRVFGPALSGERVQVSGANGRFDFRNLPPGDDYSVVASFEGLEVLERHSIPVEAAKSASIQLAMQPEEMPERIEIAGHSVLVELVPGVRTTGQILGSPSGGRYLIDGVEVLDLGLRLPVEPAHLAETAMRGFRAEYGGAPGSAIRLLTRSGSNEAVGHARVYGSPSALRSASPPTPAHGGDAGSRKVSVDTHFGGPILPDFLFFYLEGSGARGETSLRNRGGTEIEEQSRPRRVFGKLSAVPATAHALELSVQGSRLEVDGVATPNAAGLVADRRSSSERWQALSYDYIPISSLVLEASVSRSRTDSSVSPQREEPLYRLYGLGAAAGEQVFAESCGGRADFDSPFSFSGGCRGGSMATRRDLERWKGSVAVSWWPQGNRLNHDFKAGVQWMRAELDESARYPGTFAAPFVDESGRLVDPGGLTGQRWELFDGSLVLLEQELAARGEAQEWALYAQDTLQVGDRLTVYLGLRADAADLHGRGAGPERRLDFSFGERLAPRLGFTWNPTGSGRAVVRGNYGEFFEGPPLDFASRALGGERVNRHRFLYPADGSLPTASNPGSFLDTIVIGEAVAVVAGLEPTRARAAELDFRWEPRSRLSVGARWVHRELVQIVEDLSVDGGHTRFIGNPGGVFTHNPATGERLATPVVFPEATREYQALELYFDRPLAGRWQLHGRYTYAETNGNHDGLFDRRADGLSQGGTWTFDLPELLAGAAGPLPDERRHRVEAWGSYRWSEHVAIVLAAHYAGGNPVSRLGAHPTYGEGVRFVTPRGTAGRTPDSWSFDLGIEFPLRLGDGHELWLTADLLNASNEARAAAVDQNWTFARGERTIDRAECGGPGTGPGTDCPEGNPNFGSPIAFQTPRTLQMGVRLSW